VTRTDPGRGIRLRRLRRSPALRDLAAEVDLGGARLLLPLFVRPTDGPPRPIESMPGVALLSVEEAARVAAEATAEGVAGVLLFGRPDRKDGNGSDAWAEEGAVARAIRAIKARSPEALVLTDVCLCAYTSDGHCGVTRDGRVDNDRTLPLLARTAVAHAAHGADLVAPSAMMDHQVRAIREALDDAGYGETGILAYSAKFASGFYGPFREAADSTPAVGDRRGYQLDPRNAREALREIALDIEEGADVVLVKPALPYLDILARARIRFDVPLAAFQVSGEYAMIRAAAARGWLDEREAMRESLTAIRRAGADLIITYFAREAATEVRAAR
jgi:porphobilinogen synthase